MIQNELLLDGQAYPVHGMTGLRRNLITMFPPKLTIGDTNKDDEQFVATLEQNVASGGTGLWRILDRTETDRAYWSELNLSYRSGMTLPPYVANYGKPLGATDPLFDGVDFLGHVYVVFGASVYKMNDAPTDGSTGNVNFNNPAVYTAANTIAGIVVWNSKLWVIDAAKIKTSVDGAAWLDDVSVNTTGGQFLATHDSTLWYINNNATFKLAAGTWTAEGTVDSTYTINRLLEYRNVLGDPALYALTTGGAYVLDESTVPAIWRFTELRWPVNANAGKSGLVWRGDLYNHVGLDGYRYTSGNPATTDASIGLSRDDGVPIGYDGVITKSVDTLNDMFVLVDQTLTTHTTEASPVFRLAAPFPIFTPRFNQFSNNSCYVAQWSGSAWTIPWISSRVPVTTRPGGMFTTQAQTYRTYWSWNGNMYGLDLPKGIRNPWQNTLSTFQYGPKSHITPWFGGLAETLAKVGLTLKLFAENTSATETIDVSYSTDFSEGWTLMTPDGATNPSITTDGLITYHLGTASSTTPPVYPGVQFNVIRFKFDLNRNINDTTKSPSIMYWFHQFLKQFDSRYGFTATLDLTNDYMGRTPAMMINDLLTLTDKVPLVVMQFKDPSNLYSGAYAVKITHLQSMENAGSTDSRGTWNISMVQPAA